MLCVEKEKGETFLVVCNTMSHGNQNENVFRILILSAIHDAIPLSDLIVQNYLTFHVFEEALFIYFFGKGFYKKYACKNCWELFFSADFFDTHNVQKVTKHTSGCITDGHSVSIFL